jgi:ubiquinone biosynthesis protein
VEDDASPAGVRLVFIDLGMTGHVDPRTRDLLGDLVHGTIQGELDRVVSAVIELTDAPPMLSSERAFRADVWEFISRFQSGTLDDLQMGALLEEFFSKVRRHRLECPADIVHLIKAITTIEGVGEMFCPTFDIIGHVSPHVERLVKQRYGFKAVRRRIENASLGYAEMAEQLPRDARDILRMIRRDKIVIKLEHKGVDRLTSELEQASQNISHALVVASLILCGAILFLADAAAGEGWGVLTVAGGASLLLAASMVAIRFVRLRLP